MSSLSFSQLLTLVIASLTATPVLAGAEEIAERNARLMAEAQVRTFKKAVLVCASQEAPDARSIEALFDRYLVAFESGTKAGLLEMYKVEDTSRQGELYEARDIEAQLQQGEKNAQAMRTSRAACRRLEAHLSAGSAAGFKQFVLDGHREYQEKRRAYCSRLPKPKNCE